MINRIAMAIWAVGILVSLVILATTYLQQAFIIELVGEQDLPAEITFVQPDGGTVYCQRTEDVPEYVCRRDK